MTQSLPAFDYGICAISACCKCNNPNEADKEKSLNGPFVGLGYKNQLPWRHNSLDMKYFTEVTSYVNEKKYLKMKEKRAQVSRLVNGVHETEGEREPLKNIVVMGRVTWDSIPAKFKPLSNRINVILSRSLKPEDIGTTSGAHIVRNIDEFFDFLKKHKYYKCFVIGGSHIYKEFLEKGFISQIFYTRINSTYDCDVFFPLIDKTKFHVTSVSDVYSCKGVSLDFLIFQRKGGNGNGNENENENGEVDMVTEGDDNESDEKVYHKFLENMKHKCIEKKENEFPIYEMVKEKRHPEYQYLNIIHDVLQKGNKQDDRTGVGVLSRFGYMMRFQLSDYFPLLTTKKLFVRGIIEELLWFIRGETNGNTLLNKNVRIWEANGTREFLDKRNLTDREVNDLGPIYGFQWRHFGAEYTNMHADYTDKGVDQLKNVINLIKTDPTNRRIILCAWNPKDLEKMALPPCHVLCQFYVFENKLSCIMYQRSCDLGLGVPFNIASYSIFTYMLAQVCNLVPYEFIHVLGNAHVYINHIEQLKGQINRIPYPFPTLKLNPKIQNIEDFTIDDIKIENYVHHDKIVMPMAA